MNRNLLTKALCYLVLASVVTFGLVSTAWSDVIKLEFEDLNDTIKTGIKDKLQKQFNDELGAGKVTITTDPNAKADRTIRYRDQRSPNDGLGTRWGDSGDGKTTNVYIKEFTTEPQFDTDQKKINGLSETGIHEIGHTYSLDHNETTAPKANKMTRGGLVSYETRAADARVFTDGDKAKLLKNLGKEHKPDGTGKKDVRVLDDPATSDPYKAEEVRFVDASISVSGGLMDQFDFGWLSINETAGGYDFITKWIPSLSGDIITMYDQDLIQFALMGKEGTIWDGLLFDVGNYGSIGVSDPFLNQKYNQLVYRNLALSWDVNHDGISDETVVLNTAYADSFTKNGFAAPEPSSIALLLIGLVGLVVSYSRSWRADAEQRFL